MYRMGHCSISRRSSGVHVHRLYSYDHIIFQLTDFGLAVIRNARSTRGQSRRQRRQTTEETDSDETDVRGTTSFVAPEVLMNINTQLSRKQDVYSFAITMWEILTGQWPFSHISNDSVIIENVKNGIRPGTDKIQQSRDEEVHIVRIMQRCWQQEPDSRPYFKGKLNSYCSLTYF